MENASKNLIIIPAKNEKNSIINIVKNLPSKFDYIIIDDHSTDGTNSILEKNNFNYILNYNGSGYDSAINVGIEYALNNNYDKIITFDADGEHPFSKIDLFFKNLDNFNIVIGQRNKMRIVEKLFSIITRLLFKINDPFCGMKGYSTHLFKNKTLDYKKLIGTAYIFGFTNTVKIKNIPIMINFNSRPSKFGNIFFSNMKIFIVILRLALKIILKKNSLN